MKLRTLGWLLACAGLPSAALAASLAMPVESGGAFNVRVTSLKEAQFRNTVRQQKDFSCGSAAVATLLSAQYGQVVGEQEVFKEMFDHGDPVKIRVQGFSMLDMKRYLDAHGYRADGFITTMDKLAAAGLPAIVLIRDNGYNHFVVLKGVKGERVLLGDPSRGTRAMSRAGFESLWINRLALVAREHREQVSFNQEADWRTAPAGPLELGLNRDVFSSTLLMLRGASDF